MNGGKYSGSYFLTSINVLNNSIPIPSFLAIWEGGIAIHGGLIGAFISVFLFCKSKNIHLKSFIDVLIPSIILGQSLGRWGNFFNNEAFGLPTNLPWKLLIPYDDRPDIFKNEQFFHPTFLYESIWNLFIFIIIILIFKKQNHNNTFTSGFISCFYMVSYSFVRFWIELLRIRFKLSIVSFLLMTFFGMKSDIFFIKFPFIV